MMDKSVRIIALTPENEVLLQFRDGKRKNEYDYTFIFMGGGRDGEETALQAAVREFEEETGIPAQPEDFVFVSEGMAHKYGPVSFYKYNKHVDKTAVKLVEGAGYAFVEYKDFSRIPLAGLMQWFYQQYPQLP